MSFPSIEECRREVARLLDACVDQKLLQGGTKDAIAYAQQAYEIATVNNVPSPWLEFAAYRLAHLRMRSSSIDCDALREIDSLFALASRSDKAGPLPLIYRLAVLQRLRGCHSGGDELNHIDSKSDEVFAQALRILRFEQFAANAVPEGNIQRQSEAFNMLEFASYFLGKAYSKLEGISALSSIDPFREGNWFVVGKGVARVKMTEKIARWELEQRADKNPELVLIELTKNDARICLARDRDWIPLNQNQAKLILTLLQSPDISKDELERKVVGRDGESPSDRFRQVKTRVKRELIRLTGNASINVFDGNRLSSEVPILGLVHAP
jgi:hypothetical protein